MEKEIVPLGYEATKMRPGLQPEDLAAVNREDAVGAQQGDRDPRRDARLGG